MTNDLSADGTTTIATYSSRHDAEVAKGYLESQGIDSLVIADDVHPPFQLTEGVQLRVLDSVAARAREALTDEAIPSTEEAVGTGTPPESGGREPTGDLTFSLGGFVQTTAWMYIATFAVVVVLIILGLLITGLA